MLVADVMTMLAQLLCGESADRGVAAPTAATATAGRGVTAGRSSSPPLSAEFRAVSAACAHRPPTLLQLTSHPYFAPVAGLLQVSSLALPPSIARPVRVRRLRPCVSCLPPQLPHSARPGRATWRPPSPDMPTSRSGAANRDSPETRAISVKGRAARASEHSAGMVCPSARRMSRARGLSARSLPLHFGVAGPVKVVVLPPRPGTRCKRQTAPSQIGRDSGVGCHLAAG